MIGSQELPEERIGEIRYVLENELIRQCRIGKNRFYVCPLPGFNLLAAQAVVRHPGAELYPVCPDRQWATALPETWKKLLCNADGTVYLSDYAPSFLEDEVFEWSACLHFLVHHAKVCIYYLGQPDVFAEYIIRGALVHRRDIVDLNIRAGFAHPV